MAIVSSTEYLKYLQAVTGVTVPSAGTDFLTMAYPMIVDEIERYLGWKVESSTIVEFHPAGDSVGIGAMESLVSYDMIGGQAVPYVVGGGQDHLTLQTPTRSIMSVYENTGAWEGGDANGSFPASTLLSASQYYLDLKVPGRSDTGFLYRRGGGWSTIPRTIQVTYVAGLSAGEIASGYSDIKLAVMMALADEYKRAVAAANAAADGGVTQSVSIEDFSTSMQPLSTPESYKYAMSPAIKQKLASRVNYSQYWAK